MKKFSSSNCDSEKKVKESGKKKISFKIKLIIFSSLIVILLFITNPTKDDFNNYIVEEARETLDKNDNSAFSIAIVRAIAELLYKRDNYYIFSTYTIDSSDSSISDVSKDAAYLGIFRMFIRVK